MTDTQKWHDCPCGSGISVSPEELETDFGADSLNAWLDQHAPHGTPTIVERPALPALKETP